MKIGYTLRTSCAIIATTSILSAAAAFAQDGLGEIVPPLKVVYYAADMGPVYEQSARILTEEWAKLGLQFQLQPVQFSTFVSTYIAGGGLEDIGVFAVGADPDRVDPAYWVFDLNACGQRRNGAKWCDEEYSTLAAEQRAVLDDTKRLELVHDLQERFYEAAPWWQVTNTIDGIVWNSDKWENVTNPAPIAAHEGLIDPWLSMRPLTEDRVVDWAYFEDVSTYNPLAEESAPGWLRFIFDTFAKNDADGETVPWAATNWESIDDTTVRITLREGMTFHDGEQVTAHDAVFTINRIVEIQPYAMSSRIVNISGAEQIDDLTFDIQLKTADASFAATILTYLFILPEHLWSDYEGDWIDRDVIGDGVVIGSGPFKFRTWRMNELHELDANPEHFHAPEYDGIRRLTLGQADSIREAMIAGTGDIATTVLPVASMSDLANQESHLSFMETPSHAALLTWVNNEKAPFTDLAFREALRQATNKQRVAIEAWLGFAAIAGETNVPRQLERWYNDDLEPVLFDIEAARETLRKAGYGWDDQGRLHYPN
ncbi:ABC transporter substrate-binding protein [Devosia sp. A369]